MYKLCFLLCLFSMYDPDPTQKCDERYHVYIIIGEGAQLFRSETIADRLMKTWRSEQRNKPTGAKWLPVKRNEIKRNKRKKGVRNKMLWRDSISKKPDFIGTRRTSSFQDLKWRPNRLQLRLLWKDLHEKR